MLHQSTVFLKNSVQRENKCHHEGGHSFLLQREQTASCVDCLKFAHMLNLSQKRKLVKNALKYVVENMAILALKKYQAED